MMRVLLLKCQTIQPNKIYWLKTHKSYIFAFLHHSVELLSLWNEHWINKLMWFIHISMLVYWTHHLGDKTCLKVKITHEINIIIKHWNLRASPKKDKSLNDMSFGSQVLAAYFQIRINVKYIRLKYSEKMPKTSMSQPCREHLGNL